MRNTRRIRLEPGIIGRVDYSRASYGSAEYCIHHQGKYDSEQEGDRYHMLVPVFMRDRDQFIRSDVCVHCSPSALVEASGLHALTKGPGGACG